MEKKGELFIFKIEALDLKASLILKQDALSLGGDFALAKDAILLKNPYLTGILILNRKQLELLVKKEKAQPFGLKKLSALLESHLKAPRFQEVRIMGVINANSDSFYEKSRFTGQKAIEKMAQMAEEGADIIDIGAVSSAPNTDFVSEEEELARLKEIFAAIAKSNITQKCRLSIDTFRAKVAEEALACGFHIINDITGLSDIALGEAVAKHDAELVIMHMQGTPKTMQQNPYYDDVIDEVDAFFAQRIERAKNLGIQNIVLDVGVGFGKRLEDNIRLIRHLRHFSRFGYELLVGASRKSMIDKISPALPSERLGGTLAIHLESIKNGATLIRCHDVKEHKQALLLQKALS